jgi:hypothetical protein
MTLLQSIDKFIEKISLTDRQEDIVESAYNNLDGHLKDVDDEDNNLGVTDVFQNGSYLRDTIIRPGFDVDVYAVIDQDKYPHQQGLRPNPQTVLTRFKTYLNGLDDYKGKCSQSRPCITIELSKLSFDVMPAIIESGYYWIPNEDLTRWNYSDPNTHNKRLEEVNRLRSYKVKKVIKAVKRWKNENAEKWPSFHVEEIAMDVFGLFDITNLRDGIEKWFDYGEGYLRVDRFGSYQQYETARDALRTAKDKLDDAKDKSQDDAKKSWKEVFGKDFPIIDEAEARSFGQAIKDGSLRYGITTGLGLAGSIAVAASKGFYGDE